MRAGQMPTVESRPVGSLNVFKGIEASPTERTGPAKSNALSTRRGDGTLLGTGPHFTRRSNEP
jgi:hypothetical protein